MEFKTFATFFEIIMFKMTVIELKLLNQKGKDTSRWSCQLGSGDAKTHKLASDQETFDRRETFGFES